MAWAVQTHAALHAAKEASSKKIKYHVHATALRYMHYNFCRVHQTLRVTPAMEAGVADHVRGVQEIADLLESR